MSPSIAFACDGPEDPEYAARTGRGASLWCGGTAGVLRESRKLQDRLDKLVAEGSVEKLAVDSYRLSNWSHLAGMK
jgi:hypothetical protein